MRFRSIIVRILLKLIRLVPRGIVRWGFATMSYAIPLKKLRQTDTLLAFYHPNPAYPVHILIVPRQAIAGLESLDESDQEFMVDLFAAVRSLVAELDLVSRGYRLIANGGSYQEFPQLHFHLICEV